MSDSTIMFEVGAVMMVAFIGAAAASRTKQSAVLGYIVAGMLIGPFMSLDIGSLHYHGLVQDTTFIDAVSQLGLILLMFFVGLEFSVTKLRMVERPAIILSVINVGVNLFTGILLGTALGWPLVDTIFLAAVMAMSCAAVAMKSLMELKRLSNPETQFLLGVMVVEDFISAIFLALVGGLVVKSGADTSLSGFALGTALFVAFFAVLALLVIPRTIAFLSKMKNDETFVIFALGIVCLCAAVAELLGVPGMIGAFFIGMTFAETKITARMAEKMAPFRDAFVAVFFLSFGMMIDPGMFPVVLGMVLVAVVLVVIDDVLITAAVSYFMGFTPRQCVAVSTSLCARGADSVMYASVGSQAVTATKGAELFPFAGALTFIMSGLCPMLMKRSNRIADVMGKHMPRYIKYSGGLIARTLSKLILPGNGLRLFRGSKALLAAQIAYVAAVLAMIVTAGPYHYAALGAAIAVSVALWAILQLKLRPMVRQISYSNLGAAPCHSAYISQYVASLVLCTLLTVVGVAFLFPLLWQSSLVILLAYLLWTVFLMKVTYDRTSMGSRYERRPETARPPPLPMARVEHFEKPQFNYRRRWKDL